MYIGPVTDHCEVDENGKLLPPCVRFENFWQSLKVYTFELDADNEITKEYFIRRRKNFSDSKGHRRVFPKKVLEQRNAKVEFSYFDGIRYNYINARKKIYCPMYAEMVQKTRYFKSLKERMENGENLLIIGFDGFSFDPKTDDVYQHLNDPTKPFGHEAVICCLLHGITPWDSTSSSSSSSSSISSSSPSHSESLSL